MPPRVAMGQCHGHGESARRTWIAAPSGGAAASWAAMVTCRSAQSGEVAAWQSGTAPAVTDMACVSRATRQRRWYR